MTQYHYLDDSGDPGLGSTAEPFRYFVLAMVQVADSALMPELVALRRRLYLSPTLEFKYHAARAHQKTLFFESIRTIQFRARAVVIDKSKLIQPFTGMNGRDLTVEFVTRLALRASALDIAKDTLIIDGGTPALCRALRIRLSSECRNSGRVRPFNKIVGGRSKNEDGLQLADMIAGAIREHAMQGTSEHFYTFASKVVDLWCFP